MPRLLSGFFALLWIVGCSPGSSERHQTLYVFGTLLEVTAYGAGADDFDRAVRGLEEALQQMHRQWHAWQGEGELVRLNRALAEGRILQVDAQLAGLLRRAQVYARQSDGLFNPAIGRLIALWGFHADEPPTGPPPDPAAIAALVRQAPGMADLEIAGRWISSDNPAVQLDLGAFAKGYALNLAIERLRGQGIRNAIVNAGGDLCVSGRHGDRPWRIGVRHPQGQGVIASLDAADGECVLTSGNYERYREFAGVRYAHIIDPRSGYPVRHVASATVISPDGALADAAATALSVAGPKQWRRIARRMGLKLVMLVDEQGRVWLTPEMRARVHFEGTPPPFSVTPLDRDAPAPLPPPP